MPSILLGHGACVSLVYHDPFPLPSHYGVKTGDKYSPLPFFCYSHLFSFAIAVISFASISWASTLAAPIQLFRLTRYV